MLKIERNKDLSVYTTLKIAGVSSYFARLKKSEDMAEAIAFAKANKLPFFILGGGSNMLISSNLKALVLKNEIKGIKVIKESASAVWLEAGAGEDWNKLVDYAVKNNWAGIENLAGIPGTVGAAPVQNIGAYGRELKDIFVSLIAVDLKTGQQKVFRKKDCDFGYRQSIFKGKYKGKYLIVSVVIKVEKKAKFHLEYGSIKDELKRLRISSPSVADIAKIIRKIRRSKLPNPKKLANAGSFFKNPEISEAQFKKLLKLHPEVKHFPGSKKGMIKIPAGWLIENAGLKGKRFGSVGMYDKQALILVNYGGANAKQALAHIRRVQKTVKDKFGLVIEPEVNII